MKKLLIVLSLLIFAFGICVPVYAAPPDEGGDTGGVIRNLAWVFNDVWEDENNALRIRISSDPVSTITAITGTVALSVDVSIPKSIITGQLTTPATGIVPVVLSADTTGVTQVILRALPSNTQNAYIRNSATRPATTEGYVVSGTEAVTIPVDSLGDIYVSADVTGEGVTWIATVR